MNTLPISMLEQIFSYCADTGVVTWKIDRKRIKRGQIAGSLDSSTGYVRISFRKRSFRAHRIAWALTYGYWPVLVVDHINGVRDDNRIINLREITQAENVRAAKKHSKKICELKGVAPYFRDSNRFIAQIRVNGKHKNLGVFESEQEAHDAYCTEGFAAYGEFFNPDCSCHQSGVVSKVANNTLR